MTYTRWYDKDKRLQLIVKTLEDIDNFTKLEMAFDLIQMILMNKSNISDALVNKMNEFKSTKSQRWYDKNETIQFAIEILQYTDEFEREELLQEIYYSLIQLNKKA